MEHKDIDRLFQEKLKDIEVTPNPEVWEAIAQNLQKKKRRVLPIWWFSGASAAIVVIGMFLWFKKTSTTINTDSFPIITKENTEGNKDKDSIKNRQYFDYENNSKTIVVDTKNNLKNRGNKSPQNSTNYHEEFNDINKTIAIQKKKEEEFVVKGSSSSKKNAIKKKLFNAIENYEKEAIDGKLNLIEREIVEKEAYANSAEGIKKGISLADKFAANENKTVKKETKGKDFIAEMAKKNEAPILVETNEVKWAVSPVVGVLKSNSFAQASALDASLNNNDFSGENTIAYGVNVSYQLTDKLALKSGVQWQKNAFITNDVGITPSSKITAATLDNVASDDTIDLVSTATVNEEFFQSAELGELTQTYGYIEIPVEIKYTFFTAKNIRSSVVSGFSSLILNENNITGASANFKNDIGSASNLSKLNFSGNIGFDVDFKITKKIHFTVNPMFKTQLNTFSKNSNGFKPYNLGVYSGIQYNF